MTNILILAVLGACFLILFCGCGPVASNYPIPTRSKSALPVEYKSPKGQNTELVWFEENRVHGFLGQWRDTSERARTFWDLVSTSRAPVYVEAAKMYDKLSDQGMAEASLMVFLAKDVVFPCNTGNFEVEFHDGTKVRDMGVLYVELNDPHNPHRYSKNGQLFLKRDIVGIGKPLHVILFLPKELLKKQIVKISYQR